MKNKIKNITIIILTILLLFSRFRPTLDFGFCMDNNGNGILLNQKTMFPIDDYYNYIGYDNNLMGKYIYTLCIYNPFTNWNDDIILRYDFVSNVSRETLNKNIIETYGHIYP